MKFQARNKDMY